MSFSEVLLVLLIALIVIKPEQIPEVALTIGRLMRFMRRIFGEVKSEMNGLVEGLDLSENKLSEPKREKQ